jgi:hypothetical protein
MIHIKLAQGMAWRKSCGPTSNGGSIGRLLRPINSVRPGAERLALTELNQNADFAGQLP